MLITLMRSARRAKQRRRGARCCHADARRAGKSVTLIDMLLSG